MQALIRDNYTCQVSGARSLKGMHVHHKNGAKDHKMQRLSLDNLVTLHPWYHKDKWYSIHQWLGGTRVKCTEADYKRWENWLRKQFKRRV